MTNIALSLSNTEIRQLGGLFSLNDLHRASGGADNHRPAQFMRTEQTQGMIAELCKSAQLKNCVRSTRGKLGGTYVCRELVYAYAMWISAAFSLMVIRAFDAMHSPSFPYSVAPNQTLSSEQAETLRSMIASHAETLPKESQARFVIQAWSKLKAHFGVGYRQIPARQFAEAVSLVGRHISEMNAIPYRSPQEQLNYIAETHMKRAKWLLSFDAEGRANMIEVGNTRSPSHLEELPRTLREDASISLETLFDIAQACQDRIKSKFGAMEEARFISGQRRRAIAV